MPAEQAQVASAKAKQQPSLGPGTEFGNSATLQAHGRPNRDCGHPRRPLLRETVADLLRGASPATQASIEAEVLSVLRDWRSVENHGPARRRARTWGSQQEAELAWGCWRRRFRERREAASRSRRGEARRSDIGKQSMSARSAMVVVLAPTRSGRRSASTPVPATVVGS